MKLAYAYIDGNGYQFTDALSVHVSKECGRIQIICNTVSSSAVEDNISVLTGDKKMC